MAGAQQSVTLREPEAAATLTSRVTWVTGATRGIGRAIALALAEAGHRLALTYRSRDEEARELSRALERRGVDVWCARQDVTDAEGARAVYRQIKERFGRLDCLVNNAGTLADAPLYLMEPAQWHQVLATNLTGVFNSCHAVIGPMMKQGWGRIVNIASVAGLIGVAGQTNYCASKAGIIGFSRALAREASAFSVTVNVVAPGYIETDMTTGLPEAKRQALTKQIPLKRMGTAAEVAAAVRFLLSAEASYITGQVLVVDGGLTA